MVPFCDKSNLLSVAVWPTLLLQWCGDTKAIPLLLYLLDHLAECSVLDIWAAGVLLNVLTSGVMLNMVNQGLKNSEFRGRFSFVSTNMEPAKEKNTRGKWSSRTPSRLHVRGWQGILYDKSWVARYIWNMCQFELASVNNGNCQGAT